MFLPSPPPMHSSANNDTGLIFKIQLGELTKPQSGDLVKLPRAANFLRRHALQSYGEGWVGVIMKTPIVNALANMCLAHDVRRILLLF